MGTAGRRPCGEAERVAGEAARAGLEGVHRVDDEEMPAGCEIVPHANGVSMFEISHGRLWMRASAALGLLAIAVFAPENRNEVIPGSYQLGWQQHVFHVTGWWGWQDHFREIVDDPSVPQAVALDFGPEWDSWGPVTR